jgi:hypothetical protein
MIGLAIGLVVGAMVGAAFAWWAGYSTGQSDAECETWQCWPWDDMQDWKGE